MTYSKDNNFVYFNGKVQKFGSNSSSECLHSKTFKLRPEIPYPLKVIVETVTEGHFSTHFLSDYDALITSLKRIFYPKFHFSMIDHAI